MELKIRVDSDLKKLVIEIFKRLKEDVTTRIDVLNGSTQNKDFSRYF